jgi:hypothetical protein
MTRRQFAFWVGFGLFSLGAKLRFDRLDQLAANLMDRVAPPAPKVSTLPPVHWTPSGDDTWRWYEQEVFIDGQWRFTGTTTPVNKQTGERRALSDAHLDDDEVPEDVRLSTAQADAHAASDSQDLLAELSQHHPSAERKARHGRPPSKWLRSLNAEEIRIWLGTIEVPEAGVSGMTYWEHLTRDHSFDPLKIAGLTIPEQAKLHGAAHFGY